MNHMKGCRAFPSKNPSPTFSTPKRDAAHTTRKSSTWMKESRETTWPKTERSKDVETEVLLL